MVRNIRISARDYSALYKQTGIRMKLIPSLVAIKEINDSGEGTGSNLRLSKALNLTAVRTGQITSELAKLGAVKDVSKHPLRRAWVLTDTGSEVIKFVEEHSEQS